MFLATDHAWVWCTTDVYASLTCWLCHGKRKGPILYRLFWHVFTVFWHDFLVRNERKIARNEREIPQYRRKKKKCWRWPAKCMFLIEVVLLKGGCQETPYKLVWIFCGWIQLLPWNRLGISKLRFRLQWWMYIVSMCIFCFCNCQAKMERVRALQQQLHSESTRPMPENVETAAPGVVNCLVHVHGTQILFTKHFRTQVLFWCWPWTTCTWSHSGAHQFSLCHFVHVLYSSPMIHFAKVGLGDFSSRPRNWSADVVPPPAIAETQLDQEVSILVHDGS